MLACALAAIVLCASGDGNADDGGGGQALAERVVELVNKTIAGRLDAGSLGFSFPSTVVINDVALRDPKGAVVMRIRRVEVAVRLRDILRRELHATHVLLEGPRLFLAPEGDSLNIVEALRSTKQKDPDKTARGRVVLEGIEVKNAAVRYDDGDSLSADVAGVAVNASADIDLETGVMRLQARGLGVHEGTVVVAAAGTGGDKPVVLAINTAHVDAADLIGRDVTLTGAEALVQGVLLQVAGNATLADAAHNDAGELALHGEVRAPRAVVVPGVELPFTTPRVHASFNVGGTPADPRVHADGEVGAFTPAGVAIDGGAFAVRVSKALVDVRKLTATLGDGTVSAAGTYRIESGDVDARAGGAALPLARLAKALGKQELPQEARAAVKEAGHLAFHARVSGATKGERPLVVAADVESAVVSGTASGRVFVAGQRLDVDVDADVARLERVLPLADGDEVGDGHVKGNVSGPFDAPRFAGAAALASATVGGVPMKRLGAVVDASKTRVALRKLHGRVAGGALAGAVDARLVKGGAVGGRVTITGVDLATLTGPVAGSSGRGDLVIDVGGTGEDPVARVTATARDVIVRDERIGSVHLRGSAGKTRATVDALSVRGPEIALTSSGLAIGYGDTPAARALGGRILVERLALSEIHAASAAALDLGGRVSGEVDLAGTLDAPDVTAALSAQELVLEGGALGDGDVHAHLSGDEVVDARALIAQTSAAGDVASRIRLVAHVDIAQEQIAADAVIDSVDVEPFLALVPDTVAPLTGRLSGTVVARGTFAQPDVTARLHVPNLVVAPTQRILGPLFVDARLAEGTLDATVRAFDLAPAAPAATASSSHGRALVHAAGPVDVKSGALDITADAVVDVAHIEELVPALQKNETALTAAAQGQAHVRREAGGPATPVIDAQGTIAALRVKREGAPELVLTRSVDVSYQDGLLRVPATPGAPPLSIESPDGSVRVTAGATVGPHTVNVDVDGVVPLILAKIAGDAVANATGTARVKASVSGDPTDGLRVEGTLAPSRNATITPRATGERVTFLGGGLRFGPADEDGLVRVTFDDVHVETGGGDAVAKGSVDVRAAFGGAADGSAGADEAAPPLVAAWDLAANGEGLFMKHGDVDAELSFALTLTGASPAPALRGNLQIADGDLRKEFAFSDFVISADIPSDPRSLAEQLAPIGLGKMTIDVDVGVRDFRAQAQVPEFSVDAFLRGDFSIKDTIAAPRLVGALGVETGEINFPRARFDITDLHLELPTGLPGSPTEPTLLLTAHADIPPGVAGNDVTLPIDMTLDGPIDTMQLDFSVSGGATAYTRADVLSLVLFGRPLDGLAAGGGSGSGWQGALGIVSAQASSALTRQLSDEIERQFGGQLELNLIVDDAPNNDPRFAAGWRWRVGQRLDFEGTAGLGSAASAPVASAATQAGADWARLRLLLFDHLPVGDELAFEGSVLHAPTAGAGTAGELRLAYRLFEGKSSPSWFAFLFGDYRPGPAPHAPPRAVDAPPALVKVVARVHGGAAAERKREETRVRDSLAGLYGRPMGDAPPYTIVGEAEKRLRAIGGYRRIACAVVEPVSGGVLGCDVTKARVVRAVHVEGLPVSMLERDFLRRLSLESGDVLDPLEEPPQPAAEAVPAQRATDTAQEAAPAPAPTAAEAAATTSDAALRAKLDREARSLKDYLEREGFHGAAVDVRAARTHEGDPSLVDLVVDVKGGAWLRVRRVYVNAREAARRDAGAGSAATGAGASAEAAAGDEATAGDTEILAETVVATSRHQPDVLDVDAIKRRFGALCLRADGLVEAGFRGTFSCYSRQRVRERTEQMEKQMRDAGYPEARVRVSPRFRADGTVDLKVRVRRGPRLTATIVIERGEADVDETPAIFTDQSLWLRHEIWEPVGRAFGAAPDDDVVIEDLRRQLTFDSARSTDEAEAQVSADALAALLRSRGHLNATVTATHRYDEHGDVHVRFDVNPGPTAVVRDVRFEAGGDKKLEKILEDADLRTRKRGRFTSGFVNEDRLTADDETLRAALEAHGWPEASVEHHVARLASDADAGNLADYAAVFHVDEGERFLVRDIELAGGDPELTSAVLSALTTCRDAPGAAQRVAGALRSRDCAGGPFLVDELDGDAARIKALYAARGYVNADVDIAERFDAAGGDTTHVDLRITVAQAPPPAAAKKDDDEGAPTGTAGSRGSPKLEKAALGNVFLLGNTATNGDVLRRELGVSRDDSGKPIDPVQIQKGVNRVRRSGLYSRVGLEYVGLDDPGVPVDLVLQVEEKPSLTVDSSVGFSTERLFHLGLETRQKNAFGSMVDLGGVLDFGLYIGRFSQVQLPARWPRMLGTDLTLTLTPFASYRDESSGVSLDVGRDPVAGVAETFLGQVTRRRIAAAGAAAGLDYAVNFIPGLPPDTLTVGLAYELRNEWTALNAQPYPLFSGESLRTISGLTDALDVAPARVATITPRIYFSDVDNPFDPLRGFSAEVLWKASSPYWASQNTWGVLGASTTGYVTAFNRLTFAGRAAMRWGFVQEQNLSCTDCGWALMQTDLFLLGGERSIRGYGENTVGVRSALYTPRLDSLDAVGPRPGRFGAETTLELRYLAWKNLGIGDLKPALFVDAGVSTDDAAGALHFADRLAAHELGLSVGAGLRYVMPVGPALVDCAVSPVSRTASGAPVAGCNLALGYTF